MSEKTNAIKYSALHYGDDYWKSRPLIKREPDLPLIRRPPR